ncbi:MAG: HsdR family type I site-specific deoxyribonuclease, partial [Veillonella sp.]|nr:HsdR family type I site-specific deoxyribonuclease [Veillonella sp.]
MTILINGLPLVQIELKRSGVAITEAFNQIERYRRQNYTGLFRYIQLFVVSNKMETRYYANSDREIFKGQMFYWSNEQNERINYLKDFIEDFLEPCHIAKMISRYMVVNETDKFLMALRPYQVYAVEAILNRALETNNNGYIWHTTGSGKTLTSFKASQLLSQEENIKKVIFLVDRKDLDNQTLAEFNKFQEDSVDFTDNTRKLLKQLADPTLPLIVTTIQKMANAVKSNHSVMESYKQDKVIFIIDECHRSTFGDMLITIKNTFPNALFFGFTGTPVFSENEKSLSTTTDIFGDELHRYSIADGIRDKNVLGFDPTMVCVYPDMELRKKVAIEQACASSEEEAISDLKMQKIYYRFMTASEVPMAGRLLEDGTYQKGIEDYIKKDAWENDKHQYSIVDNIKKNWLTLSRNNKFHAIFATSSIPEAISYYRKFREKYPDLKVTGLFDPT